MQLYLENLTFRACFFRFHLNLINQEEWLEKKELLFSNIEKKESKISLPYLYFPNSQTIKKIIKSIKSRKNFSVILCHLAYSENIEQANNF